jgi:uncharacterized protein YecT (DUF1311 family)
LQKYSVGFVTLALLAGNIYCLANEPSKFPSAETCKAASSNLEVTRCLGSVADELESLLPKYLDAKRADIRKTESELRRNEPDSSVLFENELESAIRNLERAQSSWKSYRDAHCEMSGELYLNGSGRAAGEAQCLIDLTTARIRELDVYGSGLPKPI